MSPLLPLLAAIAVLLALDIALAVAVGKFFYYSREGRRR